MYYNILKWRGIKTLRLILRTKIGSLEKSSYIIKEIVHLIITQKIYKMHLYILLILMLIENLMTLRKWGIMPLMTKKEKEEKERLYVLMWMEINRIKTMINRLYLKYKYIFKI